MNHLRASFHDYSETAGTYSTLLPSLLLSAAREMFQRSFDIRQDMRSRGILEVPDASKPEEVAREIAKGDAALAK